MQRFNSYGYIKVKKMLYSIWSKVIAETKVGENIAIKLSRGNGWKIINKSSEHLSKITKPDTPEYGFQINIEINGNCSEKEEISNKLADAIKSAYRDLCDNCLCVPDDLYIGMKSEKEALDVIKYLIAISIKYEHNN